MLFRLVVKKLVEVAFVITDDVAKMFCANRFRNLLAALPSEYVMSKFGVRLESSAVIVVVARVDDPVTVRLDTVVVARLAVFVVVRVPVTVVFPVNSTDDVACSVPTVRAVADAVDSEV